MELQQLKRGEIYTLVESGTNKSKQEYLTVYGNGTNLNNIEALKRRAKRKTITQSLMLKLIDIAKDYENFEMENAFWNTYYCQKKVVTSDGKLYSDYCKNRFCTICCCIRKADIIHRYIPILSKWEDPHFVTITVKSCKSYQLERYFKSLKNTFNKIVGKYKKQDQRGTGKKLIGIKSLESNYNAKKKTYNPHFHIIVANKEMAEIIVKEWYDRSKNGFVNLKGQKIKRVWNLEKALIEIVKYGSKIFTEPDLEKRTKETEPRQIYVNALYTIFKAMRGKHIFGRFGFNLPEQSKIEKVEAKILTNYKTFEFDSSKADWENTETDEVLSGYTLPSYLQALLENNINCEIR